MPADPDVVIPRTAEELTPAWFSEVLGSTGGDAPATVTDVRIDTIGTGVGFMGDVHRCHLTWEGAGGHPASVIVKLPTTHPTNFALGDGLQLYEREIVVYRDFADGLGIPMPALLHSAMDPDPAPWVERIVLFLFGVLPLRSINWLMRQFLRLAGRSTRRYVLVIEDVVDARPPRQVTGGSLADAEAALDVLAAFHAANWMRTDVSEAYRRIWPVDRGSRAYQAAYLRNRDEFVARFGDQIGQDVIDRLDEIQAEVPRIDDQLAREPWTLLHGDYRLDNILFRPDGSLVVLDYQGLSRGRPGLDVAYFITTALTAEHRDEEQRLLRRYHEALLAAGITTYSWRDLRDDVHVAKRAIAHRIVGAADVLDTELDADGDAAGSFIDVMQLRVLDWLD